jgi:hypothetical protein
MLLKQLRVFFRLKKKELFEEFKKMRSIVKLGVFIIVGYFVIVASVIISVGFILSLFWRYPFVYLKVTHPHNSVLEIYAVIGVIVVLSIIMLALIGWLLKMLIESIRNNWKEAEDLVKKE